MKKAIVTAANSFIGYRLCMKLVENGWFVFAVIRSDKNIDKLIHKNIKIIYEEMSNYAYIAGRIDDECDVGVALAWEGTRGKQRNDYSIQEKNYRFSKDCICSFIKMGCGKVVLAGSQAEYGPRISGDKVVETDSCNPNTEYGKHKLKLYKEALSICEKNNVSLIEPRFFSLYGPDDYEETLVVSMVSNMLSNLPCKMTECVQVWDFLYIDDAVEALYRLIESNTADGIYNFGSGVSQNLKKYVETMYKITSSNSSLLYGAVPYPDTGIVNTNPSIERLCSEINWKPKISFEDGIKEVIKFQKHKIDKTL